LTLSIITLVIWVSTNPVKPDTSSSLGRGIKADSIEIVHFHATQQCWSCRTVGEYALKTITEQFASAYASGQIKYLEINIDLPENRDIVTRYQARGSSLYVNAIVDGVDHIEEDVRVWRLVGSEDQYLVYFGDRLKQLLGE